MLRSLCLKDVSLARHLHLDLGARLNVLTGDNGLGKTLILEAAWWALTGSWAGLPLAPRRDAGASPKISFDLPQDHPQMYGVRGVKIPAMAGEYDSRRQAWVYPRPYGWTSALVLYLQVDGTYALWDAARHAEIEGNSDDPTVALHDGHRFDADTLWNGMKEGDRVICRGLIDDWVSWQTQRDRDPHKRFDALAAALDTLAPHPGEWMHPGEPQRVFVGDARDFPTVQTPYGVVPVVHASAAMKRILGFAYLLVWAWNEHREASRLNGTTPVKHLVVLCDEVETHLHPQWQRRIVPSLLNVAKVLDPSIEVQFLLTTHSPLVLASIEPSFDEARDRLFLLDLNEAREVVLEQVPWAKHGEAQRWLTSEVFGLKQTRSIEAEQAIEAAMAFMRGDATALPEELTTMDAINARLRELLPGQDPFWPRWLVHTGEVRR